MTKSFSFPTDKYVLIGKITKAHGIKGEVKVLSFSDQPQNIEQYKELILVSDQGGLSPPFPVIRSRTGTKEAIVSLKGVTDRSDAEDLSGYGILVPKDALPKLTGDDFYLHELEGLQVVTKEGRVLGKVHSFFDNGAQDIIVVQGEGEEYLIPLIPGIIVQRNESELTIAPAPGLLEMNSSDKAKG